MQRRFYFNKTPIKGVFVISVIPLEDARGSFFRTFCENEFSENGIDVKFVQLNQSINAKSGTFRGMHYQKKPFGEQKLVKCTKGSVIDFVLDLRQDSDTYLHSYNICLSEENKKMIFIPEGVAHGFLTIKDDTHLIYHHSTHYVPGAQSTINYLDPKVQIDLPSKVLVISEKDKQAPFLDNDFNGY